MVMENIIDRARFLRGLIEKATTSLSDSDALTGIELFPRWETFAEFTQEDVDNGLRIRGDDGRLYRVTGAHVTQDNWKPSQAPTLFELIEVDHMGTEEDPIPAAAGLRYFKDKYYLEGDKLYLCIRDDSVDNSGTVLYYVPSEVVGVYFEEVVETPPTGETPVDPPVEETPEQPVE